ncbi:MAG: hypothetical protein KC486_16185 [Myxococcales bacterium]|nr:hypothetical protein [Myxococcales bacterium]MCA9689020.1 hypothetical protein [Myxococcales bacterium]
MAGLLPLGCQQIKELVGLEEKTEEVAPTDTETKDAAVPETKAPEKPPVIAHEELPAVPETAQPVDDLFQLIPDGESGAYAVVRHPEAFMDYFSEGIKLYEKPIARLAAAATENPMTAGEAGKATGGFAEGREKYEKFAATVAETGLDLSRGLVVASPKGKDSDAVIMFVAKEPDALKNLLIAMEADDAEKTVCKAYSDVGYMGCADSQKALDAFKPGGDAAKHREAAEASLPGVNLDEANVIAHIQDESDGPIYLAISTPPGTQVIHVSLPNKDAEMKQAKEIFKTGSHAMLRYAQPGTGFFWFNVDMNAVKASDPQFASAPPPVDSVVNSMTGEIFIGGSSDPAGLQVQVGLTDAAPIAGVIELALAGGKELVPKSIPDIPGSKIVFEGKEIDGGSGKTKALHLNVSGIPEADAIAHMTKMDLDAWFYAHGDAATLAIGVNADNVGKLHGIVGAGASETTLVTLPKSLRDSLAKDEVNAIIHVPVDTLQGPQLRKLIDAGMKKFEMAKPELAHSILDLFAPFSSTTMWITESDEHMVVHFALRGIGNTSSDEGKEALAATVAVLGGAARESTFAALVEKYPASPYTAAYMARGGVNSDGMLAGSAIGLTAAAVAVAVPLAFGMRNEELITDLGITIEKKPEPKPVKKTTPKPKATDDKKATDTKAADDKKATDTKTDKTEEDKKAADAKAEPKKAKLIKLGG